MSIAGIYTGGCVIKTTGGTTLNMWRREGGKDYL
jgi:hypothetical protein